MLACRPASAVALGLVLALSLATPARAEVRGGAFDLGFVTGAVDWSDRIGLEPCWWFGGFAGHRFDALAERLHLGFRAGWEGCVAQQEVTGARIDMILMDVAFTYGVKVLDWLMPYGLSGGGFLIADATPSGGGPVPRTTFHGGGGVVITIGPHLLIDAGVRILVFENIQFGGQQGQAGTVGSPLFFVQVGGQMSRAARLVALVAALSAIGAVTVVAPARAQGGGGSGEGAGDDGGDAEGAEGDGFAPDVGTAAPLQVGFRADFRAGWNLTDGAGIIDNIGMGVSLGPQIGEGCKGCPPALGPYVAGNVGVAEEGRVTLRVVGGLELGIGVATDVEIVPSFFGGFFKAFDGDERQGPCGGASVALRVSGPNDFFFSLEPVTFVMLPPPPSGFTKYTTHFALDMGIVRFGGKFP